VGHPANYFIRYTLAQRWGDTEVDVTCASINETLKAFGLLALPEPEYNRIRTDFKPPVGFRFNNVKHKETREFMTAEKLTTLWQPTPEDGRVIDELIDGHRKLTLDLQLLLTGDLPHDIIAKKLSEKYRLKPVVTERMISMYYHYFWNVTLCTPLEFNALLEGNPTKDAFMSSLYCGEQQALYRAGFSPKVDGNRALKEAYRQAFFRLEALRFKPDTKDTTSSYSVLTTRMLGLHEVLYSGGTGLQDQLKEFRSIMMKTKDPVVKSITDVIDKLAGGSYTGDGSDEKPSKKDDEGDQE
jgi:hypothetical protein